MGKPKNDELVGGEMTEPMTRKRFLELPMDARREILRLQAELLQSRTEAESHVKAREQEIVEWMKQSSEPTSRAMMISMLESWLRKE